MPKLTKRIVDAATPAAKDYFLWDSEMPRFGVRVLPSGFKSYVIQYRDGGRTRRVGVGPHGTMTVDEARKRARELLVEVEQGKNPAERLHRERLAPTVGALCDRFMKEHVAHRCKPSTRAEYQRSVDFFIKPKIGSFRVTDVERPDIARLHQELQHIPYQANRTLGVLSKMFNLAELWGLRPDGSNPCRHVRKYTEMKRERFLSKEERARLWDTLEAVEREAPEMTAAINAFRLLMMTGCRLGEIQTLKWSYIVGHQFRFPDSKTGAKTLPVSDDVLELLKTIPRLPDNPYVIAGAKPGHHLTDLQRPWRRVRNRAGLSDVRIHDLRHTFASVGAESGLSLTMIGKLLGHRNVQTTARYAHLHDDPQRLSTNVIAAAMRSRRPVPQAVEGDATREADASL